MAEELQSLLDRIQKEGVDKAETEARRITDEAKSRAAALLADAEAQARARLEKAARESEALMERGRRSLEQAARDTLLIVRDSVTRLLEAIVRRETGGALQGAALAGIISDAVQAYMNSTSAPAKIGILVPVEKQKALADAVLASLAEALRQGVTLKGDGRVVAGFSVHVEGQSVIHDFSETAIAASICELVRPHLAEVVRKATGKA